MEPALLTDHLACDFYLHDRRLRDIQVLPIEDLPMPGQYRYLRIIEQLIGSDTGIGARILQRQLNRSLQHFSLALPRWARSQTAREQAAGGQLEGLASDRALSTCQ